MNVYVLRSEGGMCKIGIATNPAARLSQLITGHPYKLEIAEVFEVKDQQEARTVESRAHQLLSTKRMKGEWFSVEAEEAIATVHRAIEITRPKIEGVAAVEDNSPKCSECRFYLAASSACRRRAPVIDEVTGGALWPVVSSKAWCGEYQYDDDL